MDYVYVDNENDDDFDDVHDIPLLNKAYEPLYEGSKINLLSTILLIMNLKVMNGLSNIAITRMLRYLIIYDRDKVYLYSSNNCIVNSLLIIIRMKSVLLILFIYYINYIFIFLLELDS